MSLDPDALVDRRRLKRRLTLWRTLAIVVAVVLVAVVFRDQVRGLTGKPHIARFSVSGIITDDPRRAEALSRVAENGDAKALIVHINSPGGTTVGAEGLFHAVRKVALEKPVVTVIGTLGASAGYLVALAGDHIVARATSLTASIGVLVETAEFSRLLDKLGVSTEAVKSGALKNVPSPFEPLDETGRAAVQAVVDDSYQWFVDIMVARRPLNRPRALELADGRVFTGRQALAARLIDELGGESDARKWLETTHGVSIELPTHDVELEDSDLGLLFRLLGLAEKTLFSERLTLDGLISVWHPQR